MKDVVKGVLIGASASLLVPASVAGYLVANAGTGTAGEYPAYSVIDACSGIAIGDPIISFTDSLTETLGCVAVDWTSPIDYRFDGIAVSADTYAIYIETSVNAASYVEAVDAAYLVGGNRLWSSKAQSALYVTE